MAPLYTILFPAYNEEKTLTHAIHETVLALQSFAEKYEVIIVNDGSTDETSRITDHVSRLYPQVRAVHSTQNIGKGAAIQLGIKHARGEWVVFLDVDLATHPAEILPVIRAAELAPCVIGSRRHPDTRIDVSQPWYRVLLGRGLNAFLVRGLIGLPFADTQCGFKFIHRSLFWAFKDMRTKRWMFDAELLARLHWKGVKIQEVPVHWRHGRESRVKLSDIPSVLKETLAIYKQKPR